MNVSANTRSLAPASTGLSIDDAPNSPSKWCNSRGKRLFDLVGATLLLVPALPLMFLISLAIATSPGSALFAHERVGQGRKRIRVLKFRTMIDRGEQGPAVTRKGDPRITRVGRFMRHWKLDELPQLINVIRGDLSLVGPRPDVAEFLNQLPADLECVLTLKPGIISVATLQFHNEEELLAHIAESDLTTYYVDSVLPRKVRLDLEYAGRATMLSDLRLLLKTVGTILHRPTATMLNAGGRVLGSRDGKIL